MISSYLSAGIIVIVIAFAIGLYAMIRSDAKQEVINEKIQEEVKQTDEINKLQETHRTDSDAAVRERMLESARDR